jgi:uncharacterized protein (TIGR00645 family)
MNDASPPPPAAPPPSRSEAIRYFERAMFASRWLLAPFYAGMAVSLALLLVKFVQKTAALVAGVIREDSSDLIVDILAIVDLSLVGNLLLMVMFAGYETFVARFDLDDHPDKPDWMGHLGIGGIKLKLMTSIVAISAIQLLEDFMHAQQLTDRELAWGVGIHLTFVVSAVMLAMMDRVSGKES